MGNNLSVKLKEEYRKKNYKILTEKQDSQLGVYAIISIKNFKDQIYFRKIINPNNYNQYTSINDFVQNLSKTHSNICEFYFVEQNNSSKENFDLIFENGKKPQPKQTNLKALWKMIGQIVQAMCFIEKLEMHYPFLHKKYIIQVDKQTFKLFNPYCFKNYLKDVLHVYMNPMKTITIKKEFCQQQILQNIIQFGCMILSFLENFDDQKIYQNPNYRKECLQQLQDTNHPMFELIDFVFDPNMGAKSFNELQEWLEANVEKHSQEQESKPDNFFKKIWDKSKPQTNPKEKLNALKDSGFKIFGLDKKQQEPLEIGKQIQKEYLKEEQEHMKQEEAREQNKEEPTRRQSLNSQMKNSPDNSVHLREDSLNQQPIYQQGKNQEQENITSYLKNQQLNNSIDESLEPSEQEDVAKFIAQQYEDTNVQIQENQPMKIMNEEQEKPQNQLQKKDSQEQVQKDTPQNNFDPFKNQQKQQVSQINKVVIKWDQQLQKLVKNVEYKDGRTEVVEMNDQENQRYSTITNQRRHSTQREKQQSLPSPVLPPQEKIPTQTFKCFLYYYVEAQPLLLIQTELKREKNDLFSLFETIVDQKESQKSSRYHKVHEEGIDMNYLKIIN